MTRFLAIIRRIFWGGTISLILCALLEIDFSKMLTIALKHNTVQGYISMYFLLSPVLFLLFTIFSVIYIRQHGQLAAVHQSQSPITSFFRCFGHDLAAPFKNIGYFFMALFSKNVIGRGILILRFIEMVVLTLLCLAGIGTLID